jgi:hypothetical protein
MKAKLIKRVFCGTRFLLLFSGKKVEEIVLSLLHRVSIAFAKASASKAKALVAFA